MKKVVFGGVILFSLILIGASCGSGGDLKEKEEKEAESKGGSCDSIELDSTCVDFIGSFWSESYCTEEDHFYSEYSCPEPTVGGCRFDSGGKSEKTVWSYDYGGRPLYWKSEVDDVLIPSCLYGPNSGEWISGSINLKE